MTVDSYDQRTLDYRTLFARSAPWMIARGLFAIVFGIAATFWPREQLGSAAQLTLRIDVASYLLIAFVAVNAVLLIIQGVRTTTVRYPLWGQAVVAVPAILFLILALTSGQLRAAVCVWAILHGLVELWMWWTLRQLPLSTDYLYCGAIYVLLGIIMAIGDNFGALTIVGFTSGGVLIAGVLYVLGGLTRRSRARK